jgi:hypothetical protein
MVRGRRPSDFKGVAAATGKQQGEDMKRVMFSKPGFALLALALISVTGGSAKAIDLSWWTTYDYDVSGLPPGDWVLSEGNTVATQLLNCDPSMLHNNLDLGFYVAAGTLQVMTTDDNDMIGLVFGVQDSSHFYILDWKQGEQEPALEGFSVKRISAPSPDSLTSMDFWDSEGTQYSTVLASQFGLYRGWTQLIPYNYRVEFDSGNIEILITQSDTLVWEATVEDGTYPSGYFGLYNFSQEEVRYTVDTFSQGSSSVTEGIGGDSPVKLYGCSPNPFNPTTTIRFDLKEPRSVTVSVYSVGGQRVATILDGELSPGLHALVWNGRDSNGREVRSGTYFYRVDTGLFHETRRMTVIK